MLAGRAIASLGLLLGLALVSASGPGRAADEELVLAVQPILDPEQTRKAFQPLCDYLGMITVRRCRLLTTTHFYPYWETIRRGSGFNLALDAAHFTDYRIQKLGFEVLAKIPDAVSYSIVTRNDDPVFEVSELTGKRIATLGIPSIGAANLNNLFPNPIRQPFPVEIEDSEQGVKLLLANKVRAAILPTPIVAQRMAQGDAIGVVLTTEPIPHIALSAAPSLDVATRNAIREALLNAHTTEAGRKMLGQIGFERFDPASAAIYRNQSQILKPYAGY